MHDDRDPAAAAASPAVDRWLVLGLGNPGEEYRETRHNAGFQVVERLAARWGTSFDRDLCHARLARAADRAPGSGARFLAQPQTYMNRSGHAARCLVEQLDLPVDRLLVVYDDIHLPLGRLRLRAEGGPGGHRGLESILENLRCRSVPRLRIGVGRRPPEASGAQAPEPPVSDPARVETEGLAEFVLSPFEPAERDAAAAAVDRAADACEAWIALGIETAMNRFNG